LEVLSLADIDTLLGFAREALLTIMPNLTERADGEVDPKVTTPNSDA
jgi:hypothetical protein